MQAGRERLAVANCQAAIKFAAAIDNLVSALLLVASLLRYQSESGTTGISPRPAGGGLSDGDGVGYSLEVSVRIGNTGCDDVRDYCARG
jgi:hypothetical protein